MIPIKLGLQAFKKGNINRYQRLLETLESTFYKFDEDWRIYKDETIKKSCGTIEAFNAQIQKLKIVVKKQLIFIMKLGQKVN